MSANFGVDKQFENIKGYVRDSIGKIFPIEGKLRKIILDGITIEENKRDDNYKEQSDTKAKNGTWGVSVYAKLSLIDKATGKVIDRSEKTRLFILPQLTNRYSYIVSGNEYQVSNQLRLKPGAYTIKKQNGELKTMVNLAAGKNFDIRFDETSAQLTIDKVAGGQAKIPLYPILTSLGVSKSDIERNWGTNIVKANEGSSTDSALAKAKAAFGVRGGDLSSYLDKTKISPETTKETLGESFDRVSGQMLLKASKKLIDVHFGKQEAEDRDALQFKELHGVEDFLKERLEKNKDSLAFKIKRTIDNPKREKISQIVNPGIFNNTVEGFFTQDDKSATPEQTNPLEMLSGQYKATIMGSGGIKSDHALTNDMREVHPSHLGFIDAVHTPEGSRIGANLHLPLGFVKDGNEIKRIVYDEKGVSHKITPTEAYNSYVAFPGYKKEDKLIKASYKGQVVDVPRSKVNYFTANPSTLFTWSTNLIPFMNTDQGNRTMMAAKMLEQAISLKHREAPLVQVGTIDGKHTMEKLIGSNSAIHSPDDGIVKSISEDEIIISTKSGDKKVGLYNNYSLNRKSYLHHYPIVKKGDKVSSGQLLADSNFTKDGVLALGTNLKAAYIPYKGYNFEDGIVISESAAEKLTSEHIHKKSIDIDQNTILKLNVFRSQYPNLATPENLGKLDDTGVIKKGSKVKHGDVLIAAVQKRVLPATVSLIERKLADRPKDASVSWQYDEDGVVTDVVRSGGNITVHVKTSEKAKIGDKIAGRHGNKGIITKIIPDNETPKDKDGNPVDILLNPHGVISRINIGQIYESAAGKAAKKSGQPLQFASFSGEDYLKSVKNVLSKNNLSDKEELFDASGKSLGNVHVGNPYVLKLFKQSQGNFSVRQGGPGNSYDANMQPLKAGGDDSSKNLDVLAMYSMLAHGARANLREMSSLKSSQNDEFWKALKSGQSLPPVKAPFVFDKFTNYLRASGVNVRKDGTKLTLSPLTDNEVAQMSSGEVKKPVFFRGKDLEPLKGGFLDPVKFGGFKGDKWGHIELKEPVVNPVFENAVRKITGIGKKYDSIIDGKLHLDSSGNFNSEGKGVTGGRAIQQLLKDINVDQEIKTLTEKTKKATGATLDDINKKLRYFLALKKFNLKPDEAYIRKTLPVIPPKFRPIYTLPDGSVTTSDVNVIYQNLGVLNTVQNLPVTELLAEEEKSGIRKDINEHVKGVSGLVDMNIKGKERSGFISEIAGTQPKEGFFISKMLSKKQDFVGRGTIIPEPSLGLDQVGLPEQMAWSLFEPFVIKELVTSFGKTPIQAQDEIKKKTSLAKKALELIMQKRHVMLNRAPSLHKFSIMAFKPTITPGTAIKIPPLVTKGFNADFDGDQQLNSVLIMIRSHCALFQNSSFIQDRDMTARFKEIIPVNYGDKLIIAHLEDFPHGELIATKKGEKGRIDFYSVPKGVEVLAYNESTQQVSWQQVSNWSKHYDRQVEIVNLKSGRQIITDNDPRAVYGVAAGTLSFDRFTPSVASDKRVLVPRSHTLDVTEILSKEIVTETITNSQRANILNEEIKLDESFGYVIGVMCGDGWISFKNNKPSTLCLAGISESVVNKFDTEIKKIFNNTAPEKYSNESVDSYGKSTKHTYSSVNAANLLLPLIGKTAEKKHLPPFFYNSPTEFRKGLFAGLIDTDGSINISNAKNKKPQLMANFQSNSIRMAHEVLLLAKTLGIRGRITSSKTPAGKDCWMVSFSNVDIQKWGGEYVVHENKVSALKNASEIDKTSATLVRHDIVPITKEIAMFLIGKIGAQRAALKEQKSLYAVLHRAQEAGFLSRYMAKKSIKYATYEELIVVPDAKKWLSIIDNENVTWDMVESFEVTDIKETGYDLTVPGYETFMSTEGVILSNTMVVHTPITDEANEEAKKMLPSRNLYQPGTGKLMILPSQEAQIGLFYLSKTQQGRDKLNKILDVNHKVTGVLNKKSTGEFLTKLSKDVPSDTFARVIAAMKEEGEKHAYEKGFSLGLDDVANIRTERDKVINAVNSQLKGLTSKDQGKLSNLNKEAVSAIDSILAHKLKDKNNALFDMIESGARGDASQLRSIMATPLFVTDAKGKIVPTAIKKSYSEGLDVADYWTSMYGARRGMMDRAVQTSLPGAFSKDIMANTIDNVISAQDCGTKKGIDLPVDSKDLIGRFTSGEQSGVHHNTLIDVQLAGKLKSSGLKKVHVRSPLTCLQAKGTCAKCHGIDEFGHTPELGANIGAKAGQTISEPLVQMVMNSFHTGGAAGTGADVGGYKRIDQLMKLPKYVPGAATLSTVEGVVKNIKKSPAGGYDVSIGSTILHVNIGRELKVKIGDMVHKGDALSDGVIKPQDLVKYKGMHEAQQYVVDELHKAYSGQGVNIERKVFETVVRSLGNTTQVLNNAKGTGFVSGDVAPYTVVQNHNANLVQKLPIDECEGFKLATNVVKYKAGDIVDHKMITTLKAAGFHELEVEKEAIKHAPLLKSVTTLPILKRNWMAALGYRNLAKVITEGAGQAWETDLEDHHPVPALAFGVNFGKGKDGKY